MRKPGLKVSVPTLRRSKNPGTADYRESPSFDVMHLLLEAKARVVYHDPHVPSLRLDGRLLKSKPLTAS
ncbi:MAG: hypothetical protein KGI84_04110, partial [Elusimicrobia bacterium]|nr:hypothetical protein [Elusimicrobiota bacterium]